MSSYLVTGACGFIGSNYVHHLLDVEPDATIVAVDNLGFAANEPNLDSVRDRIGFEVADIADHAAMAAGDQFAISPWRSQDGPRCSARTGTESPQR